MDNHSLEPIISTPVTRALEAKKTTFRVFKHAGPVKSLEQAAEERGQKPEQVVRSIVFRLEEGEYVMVLIAGPSQIAWPSLRHYLGRSRISMASPEEVLEATGYRTGAVSPFGLPKPMRILVDERLLEQEEVSIGSGERGVTVILGVADLKEALGEFEVGDFCAECE
jgi:Cys-tRNA(Pro)/Cys-tRNA(Cys) deacylase